MRLYPALPAWMPPLFAAMPPHPLSPARLLAVLAASLSVFLIVAQALQVGRNAEGVHDLLVVFGLMLQQHAQDATHARRFAIRRPAGDDILGEQPLNAALLPFSAATHMCAGEQARVGGLQAAQQIVARDAAMARDGFRIECVHICQ